ncbi:MAG: exported protein of unknown function [Actinomycetia bacterium]|nr:exported protein of unknown function [Actinomycetes bacterium]
MRLNRSDREVFGVGSLAFAFLAMVFAFAALVTAAQSESHSNDTNKRVKQLSASGVVSKTAEVTVQEFSIVAHPGLVQSGKVTLSVENHGSLTHELVIIQASSAAALPKVTKAGGDRSVGAIDEEAIAESDKFGEAGEVAPTKAVTKSFDLPPGTYVLFCNIDLKKPDGTVVNHFKSGMRTPLVVV